MVQAFGPQPATVLRGSTDPSMPLHLKCLHLCPAGRGTINSIELDGSHFRVVREGLHGLSLFAIGEGFLLWSTTSTNGEPVCCAVATISCCIKTQGSLPIPVGYGLPLLGSRAGWGMLSPVPWGRRWSNADPMCFQAPARSGTAVWSEVTACGSLWSRS